MEITTRNSFFGFSLLLALLPPLLCHGGDESPIVELSGRGSAASITAAALSNDGKLVFTGEDDGLVTLWSVTSGTNIHNYKGHPREVLGAALLPDGKRGVTCGDDNLVVVWDLDSGRRLHEMSTGVSIPLTLACNPEGSVAAAGCDDGQIMVWSIATGRLITTLHHATSICSLTFSPDGRLLAAGYSDGLVILWNTTRWSIGHVLPADNNASVGALAFSTDGRLIATGDQNGSGFVWSTADGSRVSAFAGVSRALSPASPPVAPVFPGSIMTPEDCNAITYLCFSPDASILLTSLQDNEPRFWDARKGTLLGLADWFGDTRFYDARYGFTFAGAEVTPSREYILTLKRDVDNEVNIAQVWRLSFKPTPIPQ